MYVNQLTSLGDEFGSKGIKIGVFGEIWMGFREDTPEQGSMFWCNSPGELMDS